MNRGFSGRICHCKNNRDCLRTSSMVLQHFGSQRAKRLLTRDFRFVCVLQTKSCILPPDERRVPCWDCLIQKFSQHILLLNYDFLFLFNFQSFIQIYDFFLSLFFFRLDCDDKSFVLIFIFNLNYCFFIF